MPEDVSQPDHVIVTGTPESCTAAPFTLVLDEPAVVYNDANPDIVIDGGGLITLDGGGRLERP